MVMLICKYYGYVDDTASMFLGNDVAVESFLSALQKVDVRQFSWTFKISRRQLDFLDLSMRLDGTRLQTFVHKKPHHNPQYLHAYSEHPMPCRKHIFKSQVSRFLILNSTEAGFHHDVHTLQKQPLNRLHPECWFTQAAYDVDHRASLLNKLRNRKNGVAHDALLDSHHARCVVCKVEYSYVTKRLGLPKAWNRLKASLSRFPTFQQSTLPEATLTIAWKCSFNLFGKPTGTVLYRGEGWVGFFWKKLVEASNVQANSDLQLLSAVVVG